MKNLITICLLLSLSISAFSQSGNLKNDMWRVTLENRIDKDSPFRHYFNDTIFNKYIRKTEVVITFEVNSYEERRKVDEFILSLNKEYVAIWPFMVQDAVMRTFYGKCQILRIK